MMWNHRPDPEIDEPDWEDNALSNSMARLSPPQWCQSEDHWTYRLADHLWAECSCCMFFRGAVVGACAVAVPVVILGLIF